MPKDSDECGTGCRVITIFLLSLLICLGIASYFSYVEQQKENKILCAKNWNNCLNYCNQTRTKCFVEQATVCEIKNASNPYHNGLCDIVKIVYTENNPQIKFKLQSDEKYFFDFVPDFTYCYNRFNKHNRTYYVSYSDIPALNCKCVVQRNGVDVWHHYH